MDYRGGVYEDSDYIPANYFCKYNLLLEEDVNWRIVLYRYVSILYMEEIEIVLSSGISSNYDDDYLRSRSYLYANNGQNYTSHTTLDLKNEVDRITVYARNTLKVRGKTFKMHVKENISSYSFASNIYSILSAMFTITLCCLCLVGCCKCFLGRGGVDYNVESANPNWDQDQMRVYQMRRI